MLINVVVQTMQPPHRIVGFLDKCRQVPSITRAYFREVSEDYHRFVGRLAATQRIPIVEPPNGVRREDWVEPFYQRFGSPFGIVVILKSPENARVAVSYPTASGGKRIQVCTRFVWQHYFCLRDHANAFVQCSDPERLQHLVDSFTPADLETPVQGWLRELVPFLCQF
jgi:hypothetical protein